MMFRLGSDDLWMQRAAGLIDIATVRTGMRNNGLAAKV